MMLTADNLQVTNAAIREAVDGMQAGPISDDVMARACAALAGAIPFAYDEL